MKKAMIFLATILLTLPLAAQHQNKAVLSTDSGEQQLNTSEIQCIRFDGGRVTVVQPWGTTVFDRTLRELTFLRPLPGTVRLTVDATIGNDTESVSRRALSLGGDGKVRSTWETGDRVYVYANNTSTESLGTLTPETTGAATARLVGDVAVGGLSDGQTLYLSTMPRPHTFDAQTGRLEDIFFATAQSQLTIVEGNASLANTTFANAQAITRFTMNDGYGNDVSVSQLVITGGAGTITVTPTAATSELYVAMPATNSQTTYSFTATAADGVRSGVKTANVQQGNYYRTSVTVKLTASVSAAPTAVNWLTYNGGAQTLVNAGTPVGGTMQYAVTTTNSQPNSGFSTTLPTSTNAGTYYVWYYVEGDSDHTDTGVSSTAVTVTIGKANGSISLSATSGSVTAGQTASISVSSHHGGTLSGSATGGDTGRVGSITASGSTISVPTNGVAAGSVTITVRSAATTNYKEASATYTLTINASSMANATTSDIGKVICSEGHIHTNVSDVTCGGTARAMIAYISSTGHGLAAALEDASSSTVVGSDAASTVSSWASGKDVTGGTWRLPSIDDWKYMFAGCGGSAYTSELTDGMSYSYGNFRSKMTACGGTDVKSFGYWSSMEHGSGTAWAYDFVDSLFYWGLKNYGRYVRAVLAF